VLSGCLNSLGGRLSYNREDRERAAANLERMGIEDLKDKSYQALSGGQQQRVLLARALCATKKLLLLDEPVTGLDPVAAGEMYNLIKLINLCDNISVIMVTHDIHEAARYTEQQIVLDENKKEELNLKLHALLNEPQEAVFTVFRKDPYKYGGFYEDVAGTIENADFLYGYLTLDSGRVLDIGDVIEIESDLFTRVRI
jgi:ABC-type Mn2+/Zn2+ transport system ATPase subunit